MGLIESAREEGRLFLSEFESKQLLVRYRIPVTREFLVNDPEGLTKAALQIGYPLVLKGCSPEIAHKTEKNLIRLDIRSEGEALQAFQEIMDLLVGNQKAVLVQEMILGKRELMAGMTRDPQFGPCVLFGLGGIFTEILEDVTFRVAPLEKRDALEMLQEIKAHKILTAFRGLEAVDQDALADILMQIGQIGLEEEQIKEIDVNPLIIFQSKPVAVDALVVLEDIK
jgi:acetate---CoA ligase (ADP-forming) subunit beta